MKKFLSLLISKTSMTILGLILLILVVWVGGAVIGVDTGKRFLVIIITLAAALLIFAIKKLLAARKASQIENQLKKQADAQIVSARPDQRDIVEGLKTQLEEAIEALKKSQLSKTRWGSAALYELPWYIIIGPPSAGKSTLLHSSSLNFPYMSSQGKGIKGVGGTRDCDWWFSNEAVFLDTAGRYAIEERDKQEWLGFLDLLKKYRSKKPINGSIIGVSIAEILKMTEEEAESCAEKLRERIDELTQNLQVKFPVYLIFTKCDLLHGFVDFFGELSKTEREQIWGCSFSSEDIKTKDLKGLFKKEFERLFNSLEQWRLNKVGSVINQESRNRVFLFPMQFGSACERLSRFMELLIQPNPYHDSPIFRGFYFTSGTQEGNPIDRVISRIGAALRLPEELTEPFSVEIEKKSYFIKDFFTKIVFSDKDMAHLISSAKYSQALIKYSSFLVPGLASAALIIAFSLSFLNNKKLLNKMHTKVTEVSTLKWENNDGIKNNLHILDQLRSELKRLADNEEMGVPIALSMGLYKGENVDTPARKLYFNTIKEMFIDPIAYDIKKELEKISYNKSEIDLYSWTDFYNTLKLYLMMAQPSRAEVDFMTEQLQARWAEHLDRKVGESISRDKIVETGMRQLEFYLSQVLKPDAPKIKPHAGIIENTIGVLNDMPITFRLYADLKKRGKSFKPFKLNDILKDEERIMFSSRAVVLGTYLKKSWESDIRSYIENAWEISAKEDWVLRSGEKDVSKDESGSQEINKEQLAVDLKKLYIRDYVKRWRRFLKGISITPFVGMEDAVSKMDVLSDMERSPFIAIFKELRANMELEKYVSYEKDKKAEGIVEKTKQTLAELASTVSSLSSTRNPLEEEYKSILKFAGDEKKKGDEKLPISQYLESLRKVYGKLGDIKDSSEPGAASLAFAGKVLSGEPSEISKGIKISDSLMRNFSSNFKPEIKKLLSIPYDNAWNVIIQTATRQLNKEWKELVYTAFKDSLEGKYPFNKGTAIDDVSLVDLGNFLHPKGGIFWDFYKNRLETFINSVGDSVSAKKWRKAGIGFSNSFFQFFSSIKNISESLYINNSRYPRIAFSIHPHVNPQVGEIFMEIDGKNHTFLNSPDEWYKFTWPNTGELHGAEINIKLWKKGWDKEKVVKKYIEGLWGFFKLLEGADIKQQTNRNFQITWNFEMDGYSPTPITFRLKAESYKNPFKKGMFSNLRCPEKLS